MLDLFKKLVKDKEEIEMEEVKTVKMLVPMSFELVDGECEDAETQELYDFLIKRDDVTKEVEGDDLEGIAPIYDPPQAV